MKVVSNKFYLTSVGSDGTKPSVQHIMALAFQKKLEEQGFYPAAQRPPIPDYFSTVTYSIDGREFTSPLSAPLPGTEHTITGYQFCGTTYTAPGALGFKVSLRDTDSGIEGIIEMETLVGRTARVRERLGRDVFETKYERPAAWLAVDAVYRLRDIIGEHFIAESAPAPVKIVAVVG